MRRRAVHCPTEILKAREAGEKTASAGEGCMRAVFSGEGQAQRGNRREYPEDRC